MNILLISGSPRKHGNTAAILSQVAEKLRANHNVEICHITDYQINGCLGCNHCQSVLDEPGCTQKDDTARLLDKVIAADVVLYGTPLYGHSYSGQLKLLMDRHVALFKFVGGADKAVDEMEIKSFIEKKPVGLIVSCQGPEENNTE
ncbi:MAG: flavodoxin family protein, partial [Bariatricus sp.]